MLVATVMRRPVFGGRAVSFDASAAKSVKGVLHVVQIDAGVAVVADGFWPAKLGRDRLKVKWDESPHALLDSVSIRQRFERRRRGKASPA